MSPIGAPKGRERQAMPASVSRFVSGFPKGAMPCIPRTVTESRGDGRARDIASRGSIGRLAEIDYTPGVPGMLPDIS